MPHKISTNENFRPIKAIVPANAIQTEFTGGDLLASIVVDALTPIKAKDDGILLICTTTFSQCKARGINGVDKAYQATTPELWATTPIIFSLRGKPTSTYDFTEKRKVEIPVTPFEQWATEYIITNNLIGKQFEGKLSLDSDDYKDIPMFKGEWSDTITSEPLLAIIKEYETGSESNGRSGYSAKPEKTYQQRTDEKLAAIAPLAWAILYPESSYELKGELPKVVIDLVLSLKENKQLDILQILLP